MSWRSFLHLFLTTTGGSASSTRFRFPGLSVSVSGSVSTDFKPPKLPNFTEWTGKALGNNWPGCDALELTGTTYLFGCCPKQGMEHCAWGLDLGRCVGGDHRTCDLAKIPYGEFTRDCRDCSLQAGMTPECNCEGKLTSIDLDHTRVLEAGRFVSLRCNISYY